MRVRRLLFGVSGAAGTVVLAAAAAFACVSGPAVNLARANAKPGEEVQVSLRDFRKADPIAVRWNALDGPVLTTLTQPGDGSPFTATFTVPADARAGNYVVIFSQTSADGKLSQMPIRTLLTVTAPGGANPVVGASPTPVEGGRAAGLVHTGEGLSTATFLLIVLGVAGVGMFVAGMAALIAGRRSGAAGAAAPSTARAGR